MKHYCVTYYDGKGERLMYVQAKSINAAKAAANDLLRKNKTIGATVRKAERVKYEDMPILVIKKEALGNMSVDEFEKIYKTPSPIAIIPNAVLPSIEKGIKEKMQERFTKNRPMQPKHINELRKQGIHLLSKRRR